MPDMPVDCKREAAGGRPERRPVTHVGGPPVLASAALFGAGVEVIIDHDGTRYRLRRTSNGKLILTK